MQLFQLTLILLMLKRGYCENQENLLRFSIVDLRAPWAPYFSSLYIENSLSEPLAEFRPWLQKWFSKHPSKMFFFFKFLNLSTGLWQCRLPPKIAAR